MTSHADTTSRGGAAPPSAHLFVLGAWVLLCAAIVLIGTSAAPAIARGMGLTEVRVVSRDFQKRAPVGQAGVDAVRDFERDIGDSIDRLDRVPDLEPAEQGKVIATKKPLKLRQRPDSRAPAAGVIPPGSVLMIVRRQGPWAQVFYEAKENNFEMGWAQLSDLELP